MLGFLAIGSVGFFILVAVACLILITTIEYDLWGWATITLIATFASLAYWGDFNIWTFFIQHPTESVIIILGYFAAGALWSVVRWWRFVRRRVHKYNDLRADFMHSIGLDPNSKTPESRKTDLSRYVSNRDSSLAERPKARDHKSRIMTWMAYWPWSMLWTGISDPVKHTFKWIYRQLQAVYERISERAYRDIEQDRPSPVAPVVSLRDRD